MNNELMKLHNFGNATLKDLIILGINSIEDLAKSDPDELYMRLQRITSQKQDPCVWDVFAAIIHEAKTGEKKNWWKFTKVRKSRLKSGSFCK